MPSTACSTTTAMTSRTFATVAALLAVMLACQLVFHFRTAIAIGIPGLRPALTR
jgi:hypothetical protein